MWSGLVLLRVAAAAVCLLALLCAARAHSSFVWLAYIMVSPSAALWDWIHSRRPGDGGVWHYGSTVHRELVCYIESHHPDYSSLLDVACNLGIMLSHLQRHRPHTLHIGSDISHVMVAAAKHRCPECLTLQFDLHRVLSDERFAPGQGGVPPVADIVLVSDVMYFMAWGGWPAALLQKGPGWLGSGAEGAIRRSQRLFFGRLASMARVEVVFSSHQLNPGVLDAFRAHGVRQRHGVYRLPGRAGCRSDLQAAASDSAAALCSPAGQRSDGERRRLARFRRCLADEPS